MIAVLFREQILWNSQFHWCCFPSIELNEINAWMLFKFHCDVPSAVSPWAEKYLREKHSYFQVFFLVHINDLIALATNHFGEKRTDQTWY